MREVWICDALRTPRGKGREGGALAALKPQELVRQLSAALAARGGAVDAEALVLGCVGQFGAQGGNIAMVSKFAAGLPDSLAAMTVNTYCASGLSAIGVAAAKIAAGEISFALAGGVEMMSQAPFLGDGAAYYADASFPRRTRFIPVALAADRFAARESVARDALDAAAYDSQIKAAAAESAPALTASRIPVRDAQGAVILEREECIRTKTRAELAALFPAFAGLAQDYADAIGDDSFPPLHTLAHAPPVCDGAGLALIGAKSDALKPRARIRSVVEAASDPYLALTAGFVAMEKALDKAGLALGQIGRIEFMESFAVTIAKFLRDYPVDPERVNASGGHLAKGHALGATGAILASTLLDCLEAADETFGLLVITAASGAGAAMVIERA